MAFAGRTADAGRIPGQRIETEIETSDSSTFTDTETSVMSVTASLVSGRTYRVRFHGSFQSTNNGDEVAARIREDDASGTEKNSDVRTLDHGNSLGHKITIEAEHTAASTGDQTFVVTGTRATGSGNLHLEAQSNRPAYLYVDYIRG